MPKGATLVNTARKEVIDEAGVIEAMTEREDLKYITDIAPEAQAEMAEKFGKRFFATPKKMVPRPPRPTSMPVLPLRASDRGLREERQHAFPGKQVENREPIHTSW